LTLSLDHLDRSEDQKTEWFGANLECFPLKPIARNETGTY